MVIVHNPIIGVRLIYRGGRRLLTEHHAEDVGGVSGIHSFIVRIWLEENEPGTHCVEWHGHITHVQGGERHYIKKLSEIPEFIRTYLPTMGKE